MQSNNSIWVGTLVSITLVGVVSSDMFSLNVKPPSQRSWFWMKISPMKKLLLVQHSETTNTHHDRPCIHRQINYIIHNYIHKYMPTHIYTYIHHPCVPCLILSHLTTSFQMKCRGTYKTLHELHCILAWLSKNSNETVLYLSTVSEVGLMREFNTILWKCYLHENVLTWSLLHNSGYFSIISLICLFFIWRLCGNFFRIKTWTIPFFLLSLGKTNCDFNISQSFAIEILSSPSSICGKRLGIMHTCYFIFFLERLILHHVPIIRNLIIFSL